MVVSSSFNNFFKQRGQVGFLMLPTTPFWTSTTISTNLVSGYRPRVVVRAIFWPVLVIPASVVDRPPAVLFASAFRKFVSACRY